MDQKKISAKEAVADIKAGMSDDEIMKKYGLSAIGLQSLLDKLLKANVLSIEEYSHRVAEQSVEIKEELKDRVAEHIPQQQPAAPAETSGSTERSESTEPEPQTPQRLWYENKGNLVLLLLFLTPLGIYGLRMTSILSLWQKGVVAVLAIALAWLLGTTSLILWVVAGVGLALYYLWRKQQTSRQLPPQKGEGQEEEPFPKPTLGLLVKLKAIPAALGGLVVSLLTGKFLLKLLAYLVAVTLFIVSVSVIIDPGELKVLKEIQSLQRVDPIPRTKELEAAGKLCQALDYLGHYMEYDYVQENAEVQALYERLREKRNSWTFRFSEAFDGLWRGKGACPEATVTATVTDFLLIGDVRDLTWGLANKYYYKEDTDDFTTALAGVGVVLWGATVVSIPTAPITLGTSTAGTVAGKASVVLLKLGNKMGKIPKSLKTSILKVLQETKETKNLKHFKPIADSIYQLSKAPGVRVKDAMTLLSRCNHVNDLEKMGKAAAVYGKKTGKFVELAGDSSLAIFTKFGHSKQITVALDSAIMYGPKGIIVLEKAGPDKFMKYLKLTKFSVRGVRSWHEGRLSEAAKTVLLYAVYELKKLFWHFPSWAQFSIMLVAGLITIGVPMNGCYRTWRWLRTPA